MVLNLAAAPEVGPQEGMAEVERKVERAVRRLPAELAELSTAVFHPSTAQPVR
jgi:hypothetical protein